MFLHSAGERGDNLDLVKIHGPPMQISKIQREKFPCIVVSPQCPKDSWWHPSLLSALLDEIEKYKVDKDKTYITGLSMGGYGTWDLISYTPDRFVAAVPICGGGVPLSHSFFNKTTYLRVSWC